MKTLDEILDSYYDKVELCLSITTSKSQCVCGKAKDRAKHDIDAWAREKYGKEGKGE